MNFHRANGAALNVVEPPAQQTRFQCAADLVNDPDLMRPREVLVPPLVVEGMVVLIAMLAKGGKSTTLAGEIRDASRQGITCALISLDEALQDTVQRLARLGANLEHVFIATQWDPACLEDELVAKGVRVLGVDHLGKIAEIDHDFGPNSQGDALLWGRLISPFTTLARTHNMAVLLLDQARRSDGGYAGSNAKAATVDIVAELREKDGGLACTPKSRIPLPAFRVDLDADGAPVFTTIGGEPQRSLGVGTVSHAVLRTCFETLQAAGEEGLKSAMWMRLCADAGIAKSTWNRARGALRDAGHVGYASRIYRALPSGERAWTTPEMVPVNHWNQIDDDEPIAAVGP